MRICRSRGCFRTRYIQCVDGEGWDCISSLLGASFSSYKIYVWIDGGGTVLFAI